VKRRRSTALAWLLPMVACTATPPMPELPPTHPASPAADAAPEQAPSPTLTMPKREPRARAAGAAGEGHRR
jgi:hypothetical protein